MQQMAPCRRRDGPGFPAAKHRISQRRCDVIRCYIVTPLVILCKDYIMTHTAVWKRVLLCCAAFEVTTTCMRRKRASWGLRWSSKAVKAQSKFAFNVKLVNILTRSLGGSQTPSEDGTVCVCVCVCICAHALHTCFSKHSLADCEGFGEGALSHMHPSNRYNPEGRELDSFSK